MHPKSKDCQKLYEKYHPGIKFKEIPQLIDEGGNTPTLHFNQIERWIETNLEDGLDLNPDFQRGHVWTLDQQIKYIEYLLKGGKDNTTIRFNHPSWTSKNIISDYNDFVIVDGLQRLTAVRKFMKNEVPVFDGYYFNDFLDKEALGRLKYLTFSINSLKTKKEVLQWYLQINNYGTPHTRQEIEKVKTLLEKA